MSGSCSRFITSAGSEASTSLATFHSKCIRPLSTILVQKSVSEGGSWLRRSRVLWTRTGYADLWLLWFVFNLDHVLPHWLQYMQRHSHPSPFDQMPRLRL